jgi:hypothetical protein
MKSLSIHQEALVAVHAQLMTEGTVEAFTPLLDWLHMTATVDGAAAVKCTSAPTIPIMATRLQTRLVQIL